MNPKQESAETEGEYSRLSSMPASMPAASEIDLDLVDRIKNIVAANQKIPLEKVSIDSTFEQLGMDSLDAVNLTFAVEEAFDLSIPDDAAKSIRSVREMADGVARLLHQKRVAAGA